MATFPNPGLREIYDRDDLGTIWEAARVAGVKPGTIRVWVSRGKIEPMPIGNGQPLYHLPTVEKAAQVKPGRPKAA
ncbi:MerR family transcriptional regulator [Streptomyces himalayensis]|uniref:MerR family transcriptional regulator n=1 Tax=Streptomyces himalayensis subsp. himalayensis TaxID=2756131 RepID=A0A7W0DUN7_9ACTN|nr:MerR family transcriptional regulator [Streptomyces himalayensis]MBA2951601.1 MerR family transcriptional regulator [Streptomyces himalayensis subsp. himalayensis]